MDQKEAGASGYWLDRKLRKLGVANLVVVAKAMGQGGKKQKTDRRDSAQLVDDLDRYMRGNEKALSVVGVPSEEQEERRALIRYQLQIMGDRKRCEARGKGLLCSQGIEVQGVCLCRAKFFRGNGVGSWAHYFVGTGARGTG